MSDMKRFILWVSLVAWGFFSLCFPVNAQTITCNGPPCDCIAFPDQPICSETLLAANTIVVKKKGGSVAAAAAGGTFTFNDSEILDNWSTSIHVHVNVTAGDLIVVFGATRANIAISGFTDASGDNDAQFAANLRAQLSIDTGEPTFRSSWAVATDTRVDLQINMTDAGGTNRRALVAYVFHPGAGKTVSFDTAATKSQTPTEGSPWETAETNTAGTDEVCVAAFADVAGRTLSNHEIPSGTAASGVLASDNKIMGSMYSIKSATVNGIEAEVDASATGTYIAEMLCFKESL